MFAIFTEALEDYSTAQDLALQLKAGIYLFTEKEILLARRVFFKWYKYFSVREKDTADKRKKQNYIYLKNQFKKYYRYTFLG